MLIRESGNRASPVLLVLVLPECVTTPRGVCWPFSLQLWQQIADLAGVELGVGAEGGVAAIVVVWPQAVDREVGSARVQVCTAICQRPWCTVPSWQHLAAAQIITLLPSAIGAERQQYSMDTYSSLQQ